MAQGSPSWGPLPGDERGMPSGILSPTADGEAGSVKKSGWLKWPFSRNSVQELQVRTQQAAASDSSQSGFQRRSISSGLSAVPPPPPSPSSAVSSSLTSSSFAVPRRASTGDGLRMGASPPLPSMASDPLPPHPLSHGGVEDDLPSSLERNPTFNNAVKRRKALTPSPEQVGIAYTLKESSCASIKCNQCLFA